jgi:hypothetical protein
VQNIPRPSTYVHVIHPYQVVHAFLYYRVHVIPQDQLGEVADSTWQYTSGYVVWYARMSHPKILPPIDGSHPRPVN